MKKEKRCKRASQKGRSKISPKKRELADGSGGGGRREKEEEGSNRRREKGKAGGVGGFFLKSGRIRGGVPRKNDKQEKK